ARTLDTLRDERRNTRVHPRRQHGRRRQSKNAKENRRRDGIAILQNGASYAEQRHTFVITVRNRGTCLAVLVNHPSTLSGAGGVNGRHRRHVDGVASLGRPSATRTPASLVTK